MARMGLGLICLVLLLGGVGCTWTSTYHEYPPQLSETGDPSHVPSYPVEHTHGVVEE